MSLGEIMTCKAEADEKMLWNLKLGVSSFGELRISNFHAYNFDKP